VASLEPGLHLIVQGSIVRNNGWDDKVRKT
jgi:hypothetical protein